MFYFYFIFTSFLFYFITESLKSSMSCCPWGFNWPAANAIYGQ